MLVNCQYCKGKKIDKATAYGVLQSNGKTRKYYCNEHEYIQSIWDKSKKMNDKVGITDFIKEAFGYLPSNTNLYKEWSEWNALADNETILSYLQDNRDMIMSCMNKEFKSEYAQIRYFSAILKNSLKDYSTIKDEQKNEIKREYIYDDFSKFKPKKKRRTMSEIEDKVDDN